MFKKGKGKKFPNKEILRSKMGPVPILK